MGIFEKKFEIFVFWMLLQMDAVVIWVLMIVATATANTIVFLLPHMNWTLAMTIGFGSLIVISILSLLTLPSVPSDNLIMRVFGPPFWVCVICMICAYMSAISVYPEYYFSS